MQRTDTQVTVPPPAPRRRAVGVWWLALTAVAISVLAPLPYLTESLRSLAEDDADLATNWANRPRWAQTFLYIHVVSGGLALLLSPLQLSSRVRTRARRLHRVCGRVVLGCIVVGGTTGLVIAPMSVADNMGTAGFGSLAILWTTFALLGLRAIRRGEVAAHRRWMFRAFALTYAAVMLRLWLITLVPLIGDFRDAYQFVPFLCWVPNLVVAELLLRRSA